MEDLTWVFEKDELSKGLPVQRVTKLAEKTEDGRELPSVDYFKRHSNDPKPNDDIHKEDVSFSGTDIDKARKSLEEGVKHLDSVEKIHALQTIVDGLTEADEIDYKADHTKPGEEVVAEDPDWALTASIQDRIVKENKRASSIDFRKISRVGFPPVEEIFDEDKMIEAARKQGMSEEEIAAANKTIDQAFSVDKRTGFRKLF